MKTLAIATSTLLLGMAAPVLAQDVETSAEPGAMHLGLQTGLVLPQVQSELGTAVGIELEAGYRVWKNLSPFLTLGYSQPSVEGDSSDPRLTGDGYMTETTQRELTVTLGAFWRFLPAGSRLNGYAGLGARAWLLETSTEGTSGGESFLENSETSTRYGAAVMGGGEFLLGPGALVGELDVGGSDLPHVITGDVATTAISLTVGYRLLLL